MALLNASQAAMLSASIELANEKNTNIPTSGIFMVMTKILTNHLRIYFSML
jgi:hypothetical protein